MERGVVAKSLEQTPAINDRRPPGTVAASEFEVAGKSAPLGQNTPPLCFAHRSPRFQTHAYTILRKL